jgi:hypothetical protein
VRGRGGVQQFAKTPTWFRANPRINVVIQGVGIEVAPTGDTNANQCSILCSTVPANIRQVRHCKWTQTKHSVVLALQSFSAQRYYMPATPQSHRNTLGVAQLAPCLSIQSESRTVCSGISGSFSSAQGWPVLSSGAPHATDPTPMVADAHIVIVVSSPVPPSAPASSSVHPAAIVTNTACTTHMVCVIQMHSDSQCVPYSWHAENNTHAVFDVPPENVEYKNIEKGRGAFSVTAEIRNCGT